MRELRDVIAKSFGISKRDAAVAMVYAMFASVMGVLAIKPICYLIILLERVINNG